MKCQNGMRGRSILHYFRVDYTIIYLLVAIVYLLITITNLLLTYFDACFYHIHAFCSFLLQINCYIFLLPVYLVFLCCFCNILWLQIVLILCFFSNVIGRPYLPLLHFDIIDITKTKNLASYKPINITGIIENQSKNF